MIFNLSLTLNKLSLTTFSPCNAGTESLKDVKLSLIWSLRFLSKALWCALFSACNAIRLNILFLMLIENLTITEHFDVSAFLNIPKRIKVKYLSAQILNKSSRKSEAVTTLKLQYSPNECANHFREKNTKFSFLFLPGKKIPY